MKKLLIMAMLLVATSANAFYTTFDYDMKRLREGVFAQQKGTVEQKEAFIQQIKPTIRQARDEAFTRVTVGCATDVARICPNVIENIDLSVKCLSDNQPKLSTSCKYVIQQNFRQN